MTALVLLLALLATAYVAWRWAGHLASDLPPHGRGALWGALVVSLPLVVVGLVGRAAGRLDAGLGAWLLVSLAGAAWARRQSLREPRPLPAMPAPRGWAVLGATLLIAAVYAVLATKYQMHDEHAIFGHKSMVEQLRAGHYPPYFPPIPAQSARYHYGFDVLAGLLAHAWGWGSDLSLDVTMLALVVLLSWAAAALVADAGVPRAAPFAAVAIHLGAGLSWLTLAGVEGRHPRCLIQYHHPTCGVELFPTPILNLFQHPVSLGVPLMLVVWLLVRRLVEDERWTRWAAPLVLILPALALGQVVYFALGVLAALAAALVVAVSTRRPAGLLRLVGVVLVAAVVARLLGGMLEPASVIDPNLILRRKIMGFPSPELVPILRHHVANLGVGFLILPVVVVLALVRRHFLLLTLSAFALGGIAVFHMFTYVRSWDIVKFPSASAFALTLLYVIVVDARLAGGGVVVPWLRRGGRALLLGSGLLVVVWLAWPLRQELRLYDLGTYKPDPIVRPAIDWLRAQPHTRHELVLAQTNVAQELAVFGGLSVVASDGDFYAMGVKLSELQRQEQLAARARATLDRAALRELGVRWLVYSDEELRNLGPSAQQQLTSTTTPDLAVVATFPGESAQRRRRIWRVE
jgi:hypothetical protein